MDLYPVTYSVRDVIQKVSTRLRVYGVFLALVLVLGLVMALGHQTNLAVCALMSAKLDAAKGPLAREIMLEEIQTSESILKSIQAELKAAGLEGGLSLTRNPESALPESSDCQTGLFSARLLYPIRFGNEVVALIDGRFHSFPGVAFWAVLALTIGGIALIFRSVIKEVSGEVERELIAPVKALSSDSPIPEFEKLPIEVQEIRDNLKKLKATIIEQEKSAAEARQAEQLGRIAAQVAHDIRSPLAALATVERDLDGVSEDTRVLMRRAVGRIRDIANQLLEKRSSTSSFSGLGNQNEPSQVHLLASLVESILSEKRMQFRHIPAVEIEDQIDPLSYGLFAKVQAGEFNRAISNLINNGVEALGESGQVKVRLESQGDQISLQIRDNGKGIPSDVLSRLGKSGETYGKEGGSGLGLNHAFRTVESWGGKLSLSSEVGKGTTVLLLLPKAPAPNWFLSELGLTSDSTVVVLDDDESIHGIWKSRMSPKGIEGVHLFTPDELRSWMARESDQQVRYLVDYEFIGFKETGLDLIQELGIASQSILVTSRYGDQSILERCQYLGVPIIPKAIAGFVPISKQRY